MEKLRQKLLDRGANSFKAISRKFRIMDDNRSGNLDLEEFTKGIRELGLSATDMSNEEIQEVLRALDKDGSGSLDINEFMEALTPPMSEARKDAVKKAFEKADKVKDGTLTVADLKGVYNVKYHPQFKSGEKTEEQLMTEFLNNFEPDEASRDGEVTLDEFMKYYAGVGSNFDDDEGFITMLNNAWGI